MAEGLATQVPSIARAYYRFESGALGTDYLGNIPLTTGGGTPIETTGKYGGGIHFDGGTYLVSGGNSVSGPPFINGWWAAGWFKNFQGPVFSSKAGSYENYVGFNNTSIFAHVQSTTNVGFDANLTIPPGVNFDPTRYNHLAWVAAFHLVSFYLNGVLLASYSKIGRAHV